MICLKRLNISWLVWRLLALRDIEVLFRFYRYSERSLDERRVNIDIRAARRCHFLQEDINHFAFSNISKKQKFLVISTRYFIYIINILSYVTSRSDILTATEPFSSHGIILPPLLASSSGAYLSATSNIGIDGMRRIVLPLSQMSDRIIREFVTIISPLIRTSRPAGVAAIYISP